MKATKKKPKGDNKGELSEGYAIFYILLNNEIPFLDSRLINKKNSIKITEIAENNFVSVVRINNDKTISVLSKDMTLIRSLPVSEIITNELLQTFLTDIITKAKPSLDIEGIKKKLNIKKLKGSSYMKSDVLISFTQLGIKYDALKGLSIKSYLGASSTLLNASTQTNFIFRVNGFQGSEVDTNKIETNSKVMDRFLDIIKKNGVFKFVRCESEVFENNLRMVDSLMPELLSKILLERYFAGKTHLNELIKDSIDKIHIISLLKAAAFGMFPSREWDGLYQAKGFIVVKNDGDVGIFHLLEEAYLNDYLFNHTYIETASTSRHGFGELFYEDGVLLFKLNCQLRLS